MEITVKKILLSITACFIALSLIACGGQPQRDPGPDYADDEAMEIIADGFEARQNLITKVENEDPSNVQSMKNLRSYVEAELSEAEKLRTRVFENSEMQETVLTYINTLDDTLKILEDNPVTSAEFYDKWDKAANERASLIKKFVEEYKLTVGEKYQETLDEIVATGTAATKQSKVKKALDNLVSSIVFEQKDDGYGYFTYSAVVENTTGIDFGNVSIDLALYDADGVKAEDAYLNTTSWAAGEKVRFETSSTVSAAETKASVSFYEVIE